MGKMIYLISAVIVVQLALLIVFGQNVPGSSLWAIFTNPHLSWETLSFSALITDAITAISLGAIVIGTFFFKSDFMVLAGMAGMLYTFGYGLSNAWQQLCSQISPYADTIATGCGPNGGLISSLIIGPIILLYIFTVISWWRGPD